MKRLPFVHLARRWWGTVRARPLDEVDLAWVRDVLSPSEGELWQSMDWRDRTHSYIVARRFESLIGPGAERRRAALAAALLHDVGKVQSHLSTIERVAATVLRGGSERFRAYLNHEAIGVELCRQAGSEPETLELLDGRGDEVTLSQLRRADQL